MNYCFKLYAKYSALIFGIFFPFIAYNQETAPSIGQRVGQGIDTTISTVGDTFKSMQTSTGQQFESAKESLFEAGRSLNEAFQQAGPTASRYIEESLAAQRQAFVNFIRESAKLAVRLGWRGLTFVPVESSRWIASHPKESAQLLFYAFLFYAVNTYHRAIAYDAILDEKLGSNERWYIYWLKFSALYLFETFFARSKVENPHRCWNFGNSLLNSAELQSLRIKYSEQELGIHVNYSPEQKLLLLEKNLINTATSNEVKEDIKNWVNIIDPTKLKDEMIAFFQGFFIKDYQTKIAAGLINNNITIINAFNEKINRERELLNSYLRHLTGKGDYPIISQLRYVVSQLLRFVPNVSLARSWQWRIPGTGSFGFRFNIALDFVGLVILKINKKLKMLEKIQALTKDNNFVSDVTKLIMPINVNVNIPQ